MLGGASGGGALGAVREVFFVESPDQRSEPGEVVQIVDPETGSKTVHRRERDRPFAETDLTIGR